MTISSQAPASLTSGSASSELARTVSDKPQHDRAADAERIAWRVSSGPSERQASAITSALSAPSSRSTKKIWTGMTSQAAPPPKIHVNPRAAGAATRALRAAPHGALAPAARGRRRRPPRAVLEHAQEIRVGREHQRRAGIGQRVTVGLQGAIELVELRVLAEGLGEQAVRLGVALAAADRGGALRLGEDDGALAVGARLDLLRPFEALRAQLLGLALTLGLHAVVDRLAGLERQVGAMEAHLVDLDAERPRLGRDFVLDDVDDLGALVRQQRQQAKPGRVRGAARN